MELLFTALVMGFLGSGHCVAMCGSLTMALGFSIPKEKHFITYAFVISLGRILGYAAIGVIASLLTQSIISLTQGGILYLSVFASILMIGIGLHIAGLNSWVLKTEVLGKYISALIEPIKKRILPIDSIKKCLLYGVFWGFLPCGLVYTALSLAMTSATPLMGGLTMLFFGLGTLPTLVGLTAFNTKLNGILAKTYVRFALGTTVIVLALILLFNTITKLQVLS